MRIQHNIMAMNAYRNYNTNTSALSKNLEKLSSGYKINRAGDDAAGLAISEKMRAQITGLEAAQKNVKDGISLVKTAEGAMQEMQDMLNRMDYLATQSANGTYQDEVDREALQAEVDQLLTEIDRIADSANFNGIKLLDGSLGMSDAFVTGKVIAATDAAEGIDMTDQLTFSAASADDTHVFDGGAGTPPSFEISFKDLGITGGSAEASVTITIGTTTFTATIGTNASAATVINAIKSAIASTASSSDAFSLTFGSKVAQFTIATTADGVKFTFKGIGSSATATAVSSTVTEDLVTAFDDFIGAGVTVSGTGVNIKGDGSSTNSRVCDITNVTRAKAEGASDRVGISLQVTASLVADGNELTIGSKTFVFQTKADNETAAATTGGKIKIDLKDFVGSDGVVSSTGIKEAIAQMTRNSTSKFQISYGSASTQLHVDYIGSATGAKEYDTYEKVKGIISAKAAGTPAVNAGIELKVKGTIGKGDTLNVGSKTYTFKGGETFDDVMKAISADFDVVQGSTADTMVIRSKTVGAEVPSVLGKGLTLQIGDTSDSYNQLNVSIKDMHADTLGVGGLSIKTAEDAAAAIQTIRDAINNVSSVRGTLGATQNRLEHTANNLSVMAENIQDAESTIRDTDVAEEMMSYVKNNILVQSAQAMLAQANQVPQGVLQLLG